MATSKGAKPGSTGKKQIGGRKTTAAKTPAKKLTGATPSARKATNARAKAPSRAKSAGRGQTD